MTKIVAAASQMGLFKLREPWGYTTLGSGFVRHIGEGSLVIQNRHILSL
jgi:hypothetical protein